MGYEVHGIVRRSSVENYPRIKHILDNDSLFLHCADLTDSASITNLLKIVEPDEIYNLGAQSHVKVSFDTPESTADINAVGALRILEAIRLLGLKSKYYQASTSEMFGQVQEVPQNENTPFYPRSPYGVAKLYAHWITKNYRESYDIFACSGILFNHESPRRGEKFVTSKIVLGLNNVANGKADVLELGNIDALRDWGHAKDFVYAMWLMLQQDKADDYVIATGEQHSVREFIELAAPHFGMNIVWSGEGINEVGTDTNTGNVVIRINEKFYRPAEVETLLGNPQKAINKLGWIRKRSFEDLVKDMCENTPKVFPDYIGE